MSSSQAVTINQDQYDLVGGWRDDFEKLEGGKPFSYTRNPRLILICSSPESSTVREEPENWDLLEASSRSGFIYLLSNVGAPTGQKSIFIADLGDPRVMLLQSLPIEVNRWPEHVTVYSHDLEIYCVADDIPAALTEMRASIVELYFMLKEERDRLGPLPRARWQFLSHVIREVGA